MVEFWAVLWGSRELDSVIIIGPFWLEIVYNSNWSASIQYIKIVWMHSKYERGLNKIHPQIINMIKCLVNCFPASKSPHWLGTVSFPNRTNFHLTGVGERDRIIALFPNIPEFYLLLFFFTLMGFFSVEGPATEVPVPWGADRAAQLLSQGGWRNI